MTKKEENLKQQPVIHERKTARRSSRGRLPDERKASGASGAQGGTPRSAPGPRATLLNVFNLLFASTLKERHYCFHFTGENKRDYGFAKAQQVGKKRRLGGNAGARNSKACVLFTTWEEEEPKLGRKKYGGSRVEKRRRVRSLVGGQGGEAGAGKSCACDIK